MLFAVLSSWSISLLTTYVPPNTSRLPLNGSRLPLNGSRLPLNDFPPVR
jgi:hypothetical protein